MLHYLRSLFYNNVHKLINCNKLVYCNQQYGNYGNSGVEWTLNTTQHQSYLPFKYCNIFHYVFGVAHRT